PQARRRCRGGTGHDHESGGPRVRRHQRVGARRALSATRTIVRDAEYPQAITRKDGNSAIWPLGLLGAAALGRGIGVLLVSEGLHEPWRAVVLIAGWLLAVLGIWCLFWFGFMGMLLSVGRTNQTWFVRPLVWVPILALVGVWAYVLFH